MKNLLHNYTATTIAFFLLGIVQLYSQMGCTDALANNYDSTAIQNDGSCTYDAVNISPTDSFLLDEVLSETSGLIYWNEFLWTHNDSDDITLYKLNPSDGSINGNISLEPEINKDWEAISQDEDYIYVGDFGNNDNGNRTDLKILRISKNSILAVSPEIDIINFAYEDQIDFTPQGSNNTDFDCEAFIVTDNAIFLFTKEWVSNKTRVYKLPKTPGTFQAQLQDSFDINGLVTGAVYKDDDRIIGLSGYNNLLRPYVILLYDFMEEDFFGGNKRRLNLNLPFHQIEGITTEDGLNYFLTNEKFTPTETPQKLHTVDLTPYLEQYLNVLKVEDSAEIKIFPNPTKSMIKIKNNKTSYPVNYIITDTAARTLKQGKLIDKNSVIDISEFSSGTYFFKLGGKGSNTFRVIKE